MAKRPYKFRKLVKILRDYDPQFEIWERRGKGSERVIYHPNINGSPASYPIKCHGEGTEISKGTLGAIERRFHLPKNLL